jgi:hypothetical protein
MKTIKISLPSFFHFKLYGWLFCKIAKESYGVVCNVDYYNGKNPGDNKYDMFFSAIGSLSADSFDLKKSYSLYSDKATTTTQIRSNTNINLLKTLGKPVFLELSQSSLTTNRMVHHLLTSKYGCDVLVSKEQRREQMPYLKITIADESLHNRENFKYIYDIGAMWRALTGHPAVYGVFIFVNDFEVLSKILSDVERSLKKSCASHPSDSGNKDEEYAIQSFFKSEILTLAPISLDYTRFFYRCCVNIGASSSRDCKNAIEYFYKNC